METRRSFLKACGLGGFLAPALSLLHCGRDSGTEPRPPMLPGPNDQLTDFNPKTLSAPLKLTEGVESGVSKPLASKDKARRIQLDSQNPPAVFSALPFGFVTTYVPLFAGADVKAQLVISVFETAPQSGKFKPSDLIYLIEQNGRLRFPRVSAAEFRLDPSITGIKWYANIAGEYRLVAEVKIDWQ